MCVAASVGSDSFSPSTALSSTAEPVEARLETLLQSCKHPVLKCGERGSFARFASLSAIAMLRESSTTTAMMFCCELSAATDHGRLPQQTAKSAPPTPTAFPKPPTRASFALRGGIALPATDQHREAAGEGNNQHRQQPRRATREQHEPSFSEDRGRIFEEKLKHSH